MSFQDLKFTEEQLAGRDIASLPDRPGDAGMTAADLKARFDQIPKIMLALGNFNSLIDALLSADAAGEIGAYVEGLDSSTVSGVIAALKALLDSFENTQTTTNTNVQTALENRYTKNQVDSLVNVKFDTASANQLVRSIAFDSSTGVFTITTQGGAVSTIDTLLEKVPVSFALEDNKLVLTLDDGTRQTADLSSFIDTYTFTSGSTVEFTQNGKNITAEVRDGSLPLTKLTPEAQSTLASYANRAEDAMERAEAAGASAISAKDLAVTSSTTASDKASAASLSAAQAKVSETNAKASETAALNAQRAAEQARDEAQAVAGGDFLPIAGGTLTGKLTLDGAPTANLHAATKKYVDDAVGNIPTPDVSGQIATHNTNTSAHADIRTKLATKAPMYSYGTEDLEAGVSPLETGKLYFVYE